ncbi:TPA: HNH endonuclease [Photobacterium damselae]
MKLNITFSLLEAAVSKMNPDKLIDFFVMPQEMRDPIDTNLRKGVEVNLEDVKPQGPGLLSYEGRQVLLYIRDHGSGVGKALVDGENGRKYHLADCNVLKDMRQKGRFERYVITNDTSDEFLITGYDKFTQEQIEGTTNLKVCKVCLRQLNYKGYQLGGNKTLIFRSFRMDEFFSTYSSHFEYLPKRRDNDVNDGYTNDWTQISSAYKVSGNYTCESCNVVFELYEHKKLLHTHHINGVKSDNRRENLKALCADCHSKQRFHEHMFVSKVDKRTIIMLRKQQSIINIQNDWQALLNYADSAVHGVLHMCKQKHTDKPEIGYNINHVKSGDILGIAELAWPERQVAVVLDDGAKAYLSDSGWRVYRTDEFLHKLNLDANFLRD